MQGAMEQVVHTQNAPALDQQAGPFSSFSLQLVQRTLEETLGSVQKSIHEDVRNLHIDLIRQFHMQEVRNIFYFILYIDLLIVLF
jgi:protein NEDD1